MTGCHTPSLSLLHASRRLDGCAGNAILVVEPNHRTTYRVRLGGDDGEIILESARVPFFDGCRELLRRGVDPETVVSFRHIGTSVTSMTSTVGKAAKLTISENDKWLRIVPYRPFVPFH